MAKKRWRSMKRYYFHPSFVSRSSNNALCKRQFFFVYLGIMLLLLIVLPTLLTGSGEAPVDEKKEPNDEAALPAPVEQLYTVQVYLTEEDRTVVMDMEVYIAGVLAAEMPASFHIEALKAQAVAARTYALQKILLLGGHGCASRPGADLCTDSTCCQAWNSGAAQAMALNRNADFSGAETEKVILMPPPTDGDTIRASKMFEVTTSDREHLELSFPVQLSSYPTVQLFSGEEAGAGYYDKVIDAVEKTEGLVLRYGGEYIEAVYHSTCGGTTAAASEVWGRDFPYLQPVQDPYCSHSPYYRQEVRLDLKVFLALMGMGMGDREAIPVLAGQEPLLEVSNQGRSGRNTLVRLPPREPERMLSGNEFRSLIGLPSTYFQWTTEGDEIVFYTRGFGHGAGLCQYGADGMAQAGKNFQQILEHYYQGAMVTLF